MKLVAKDKATSWDDNVSLFDQIAFETKIFGSEFTLFIVDVRITTDDDGDNKEIEYDKIELYKDGALYNGGFSVCASAVNQCLDMIEMLKEKDPLNLGFSLKV
jgi:hypothetical protein